MNEGSVNSINGVRVPENATPRKVNVPNRTETGMARKNPLAKTNQLNTKIDIEVEQAKSLSNISIHFNVDDETNKLVVVVTERESGRVIRTIPANELEKLQAGEILKWAA